MRNIKAGDDIFFTATMAEVLEKQGLYEDALMVYKILADTNPWDQSMSFRIERLKTLAAGRGRKKPAREEN
ncbi:MAG: hypothetical protein HS130_11015 [Deltaproteobacteria bacterium]|nr:hypothetical protein [Deltaproteobacteria bacterium]MCL4872914.1 hypothetical protein [bacterium]